MSLQVWIKVGVYLIRDILATQRVAYIALAASYVVY